ncbi:MAG: glycosyltransferase [Proteobacteria bacterium]|nr:glycosyltransferase [Pseudomonadota bacterium]
MRTLLITYNYPLPENGGDRIRTMNFVRYFKRLGNVDVLFFNETDQDVVTGAPFDNVFHVDTSEAWQRKNIFLRAYEKIKYSKPWILERFSTKSIKRVTGIIEQGNYDRILCRYTLNAYPLFFLPSNLRDRVIIDIDDIITKELYEAYDEQCTCIDRLKALVDFKLYNKYQLKCVTLAKSLICSDDDKKSIERQVDSKNVYIVPNIAPVFKKCLNYNENGLGNINTILFIGNLSYKPNSDGIKWFINNIFLRAISNGYNLKLSIAGKEPDQNLKTLCNKNNINLIESPADIVPVYNQCGAVIVPLLNGGGTRIKILEAACALRPVITTKIGAYGLDLKDYEQVLFANDYEEFVERYNWLQNEKNYKMITCNMNNFVKNNYSESNFHRSMDSALCPY